MTQGVVPCWRPSIPPTGVSGGEFQGNAEGLPGVCKIPVNPLRGFGGGFAFAVADSRVTSITCSVIAGGLQGKPYTLSEANTGGFNDDQNYNNCGKSTHLHVMYICIADTCMLLQIAADVCTHVKVFTHTFASKRQFVQQGHQFYTTHVLASQD